MVEVVAVAYVDLGNVIACMNAYYNRNYSLHCRITDLLAAVFFLSKKQGHFWLTSGSWFGSISGSSHTEL